MPTVSAVINYCTNDQRFLDSCINSIRKVVNKIIIPVSDHFFDGTPENTNLIEENIALYPDVQFLKYHWSPEKFPRYWHNYSRLIGAETIKSSCDWVLFIDVDEIADTSLLQKFIDKLSQYPNINSYKLANYWYFREPYYRANEIEDSIVVVRSEYSTNIKLDDRFREREQFVFVNTPRKTMIDNTPIFHHYSWVRSKTEMLKKVQSWGHNKDKDWISLVEEEFSRDFNGTCFINNYTFTKLNNV
jgi:hypothetical protein